MLVIFSRKIIMRNETVCSAIIMRSNIIICTRDLLGRRFFFAHSSFNKLFSAHSTEFFCLLAGWFIFCHLMNFFENKMSLHHHMLCILMMDIIELLTAFNLIQLIDEFHLEQSLIMMSRCTH